MELRKRVNVFLCSSQGADKRRNGSAWCGRAGTRNLRKRLINAQIIERTLYLLGRVPNDIKVLVALRLPPSAGGLSPGFAN